MNDSDIEDTEGVNVIIDFVQTIKIIRFLAGGMLPTNIKIQADVLPSEDAEEIDFAIVFEKIKLWFETIVSRSIVFSQTNTSAINMLLQDGKPTMVNHMMITPYEPTDEHLGMLFQSKMTALADGKVSFGAVRIESDTSNGLIFTYVGDWEKDLPKMEDWFNVKPYYFETPWWTRDDVSTLDMIVGDNVDPTTPPAWAFKLDFIEQSFRAMVAPTVVPDNETDEPEEAVVIKGAFQPKIIDGGRDDSE